ncbi:hypothetical protein HK098_005827 [Nowakowskiella sp. JEL0407]|nr:hypothetical protein HK098_005827 [Nowakowskiella sp. JEL0407]
MASSETISTSQSTSQTAVIDLLSGSVAGVTGKVVEFPFDTIKVRLQTQPTISTTANNIPAFNGALDCLRKTIRAEGIFGLYKGLSPPLIGSVIENAFLFMCYGAALDWIQTIRGSRTIKAQQPRMSDVVLAGLISGAGVSFVLTPIELVKCKLQVQDIGNLHLASSAVAKNRLYNGPWSVVSHTLKEHGVLGMYRGHLGTFLREAGGGGAWFGVYEFLIRRFVAMGKERGVKSKEDLKTWQLMTAGAFAGVAFNGILFPADVIKSRMQTDEEMAVSAVKDHQLRNGKLIRQGFMQVARDLFKAEGVLGFYRGFGITIARSAPTSAIIFLTYEHVSRNLSLVFGKNNL